MGEMALKIRTVPSLQKQLQTALILSVTFIWSYPWVGLNGLWSLFVTRGHLWSFVVTRVYF
jgi:hypothetical protein